MKTHTSLNKRCSTTLLLVSIILAGGSANAALKCKDELTYGMAPKYILVPYVNKPGALKAAIGDWEASAVNKYRKEFVDWRKAVDKKVACNRQPNGIGGYNYSCKVKARACGNIIW